MEPTRSAEVVRETRETRIRVAVDLDASSADAPAAGTGRVATGHGFLDHLLEQLVRHGRFALSLAGSGDLHVDVHHLAEDCGIVIGQAFSEALGSRQGIERYGSAFVPMDETLAHVVVDLSGRPHITFDPGALHGDSGGFTAYHLRELLRGFANHAGATLHVRLISADDTHHACEAVMKAFARALRDAVKVTHTDLPSTKGML